MGSDVDVDVGSGSEKEKGSYLYVEVVKVVEEDSVNQIMTLKSKGPSVVIVVVSWIKR